MRYFKRIDGVVIAIPGAPGPADELPADVVEIEKPAELGKAAAPAAPAGVAPMRKFTAVPKVAP
jgi:hypothetical protein